MSVLPERCSLEAQPQGSVVLATTDADTALMLRFQAGESACFDELVERYRRPVLGFVVRIVSDPAAAEEILQEAFLRVYLHRARYQPQARFSTWFYRIAQHLALNHLRDHRHDRRAEPLQQAGEETPAANDFPDLRPNMEQHLLEQAAAEQRRRRVQLAIQSLPERQRTAVILHKYQGLDYEAIAQTLGVSSSALKSLLFRAYASLRRQLEDVL